MPAVMRDGTWHGEEAAFDDGLTAARNLRFAGAEIFLTAVNDGGVWKAIVEGLPAFRGLEFYGPSAGAALKNAESFVRRLMMEGSET